MKSLRHLILLFLPLLLMPFAADAGVRITMSEEINSGVEVVIGFWGTPRFIAPRILALYPLFPGEAMGRAGGVVSGISDRNG